MFTTQMLINLLKERRPLYSQGYHWLNFGRKFKNKIVASIWCDSWKQKNLDIYPLDIDKESTYDGCISTEIQNDVDCKSVLVYITVWDGELYDGSRTQRRCIFTLGFGVEDKLPAALKKKLVWELQGMASENVENERQKLIDHQKCIEFDMLVKKYSQLELDFGE